MRKALLDTWILIWIAGETFNHNTLYYSNIQHRQKQHTQVVVKDMDTDTWTSRAESQFTTYSCVSAAKLFKYLVPLIL